MRTNNITEGSFLIRADDQSQAGLIKLMDEGDIPNWLIFEEGTTGRIIASDHVRWEYAVVNFDRLTGQASFIRVEGTELVGGVRNWIDRKFKSGTDHVIC